MRLNFLAILMALCMYWTDCYVNAQTSLKDIVNYALQHSRDVKKAGFQCTEAGFKKNEALGQGLPQVSGAASYSKMMFDKIEIPDAISSMIPAEYAPMLAAINGIDAFYMASAGVQVTQLIYSQAYWVGLKTTKKAQELYSILKDKSEEEIISEVATSYYQTGSLALQLETVNKSLDNLQEIYRIANLTYQNDLLKESSVNRLKVTITNLKVAKQTIQNGMTVQINYLKALAGMPNDTLIKIDASSMINDFIRTDSDTAFIIEDVPAYKALLKQDEIYDQQIKLAKATYLPTLAAFGKFNYTAYGTSSDLSKFSPINTIGLSLSVPIFTSGVTRSKVKQNVLKKAELEEDIFKAKDLLTVSFQNAYLDYQTSYNMLNVQKENKELARKVYDQTSLQYKEGMASMADLLNVNSDFLQAENSYNQQILKCKTAEVKMLEASGKLKSLVK